MIKLMDQLEIPCSSYNSKDALVCNVDNNGELAVEIVTPFSSGTVFLNKTSCRDLISFLQSNLSRLSENDDDEDIG